MSLNCVEIDYILEELQLVGAYIQKIVQPSYSMIVLHLYKGRSIQLLICLEPQSCRLHETVNRVPKCNKPLRFMELLRSRIKGSKIIAVEQIHHDRIVKFLLATSEGQLCLYIRLWSGAGNIILTEADKQGNDHIIDAFYRRPCRNEVSGRIFVLPDAKPQEKTYILREYDSKDSFNHAIDLWYSQKAPALSLKALKEEAERFYALKMEKIKRAAKKLEQKKQGFLQADALRHYGDMLLVYAGDIPAGTNFAEVMDYANKNRIIRIPIDSSISLQQNALSYYNRYKKAISGLAALTDDISTAHRQLTTLLAELTCIRNEQNPHIIEKLLHKKKQPLQQKRASIIRARPGLSFIYQGWELFVGRTAAENDELLRKHVHGRDMWLHTRDYAGGYVFIKNRAGKTVPLPVLIAAGNLAVFYSKARQNRQADLYYTAVKNLRRAKNTPKGTVLPSNEKNLLIRLDEIILKELRNTPTRDSL